MLKYFKRDIFYFFIFCFLLTSVCTGDVIVVEEIPDVPQGKKDFSENSFIQKDYGKAINFGVTMQKDIEKTRKQYKPLIDYLAEKVKINIRLVIMQEYAQLEEGISNGIIHLGDFPPLAYVKASDRLKGKLNYLVNYKFYGKNDTVGTAFYRGYIITKKSSNISSLKDLKGKKIAFVEKTSSSGYTYPMSFILKKGINPDEYFSSIFFTGSHNGVIKAILYGSADAGAVFDTAYEIQEEKEPNSIKILHKTPPILTGALCSSNKLNPKIRKKILSAAFTINCNTKTSDGRLIATKDRRFSFVALVKKHQFYYNYVRETEKLLKAYEKQKKKKK
jgi:phosphate/phosphite/phosphonate ABC transporter binding protein